MASNLDGDYVFTGTVAGNILPGDNSITDAKLRADLNASYTKTQRHRSALAVLSDHATGATAKRVGIFRGMSTAGGGVLGFGVYASVAATGGGSATVDLLKDGVSVLSVPIVIDSGDAAFALVTGVVTDTDLDHGDCFEVEVTGVVATAPKGLTAVLTAWENAG